MATKISVSKAVIAYREARIFADKASEERRITREAYDTASSVDMQATMDVELAHTELIEAIVNSK